VKDETLDLFKALVVPKGQADCPYAGEEMEQLVAKKGWPLPPACVWANADKEGITAEFPYAMSGVTSLLQLTTKEKDPYAGNGLLALLRIPEGRNDAATARTALEWNKKELRSATWAHFLGTWCALGTGLTYVSFFPNFACRKGWLGTIVSSQVVRAGWLTEHVMGYSWKEHFEETVKSKIAFLHDEGVQKKRDREGANLFSLAEDRHAALCAAFGEA
jgi:hypothetical protein